MHASARPAATILATLAAAATLAQPVNAQFVKQTNLVSDLSSMSPAIVGPLLVNPWGVSHSPTSPFWVSDAGSKVSTLYAVNPTTGAVTKSSLVVSTPAPPSGQVFSRSSMEWRQTL
jgi:hypothetical protein